MAVNPQSPGVYIDEIPLLPASIVSVATAIPAFIGYVEKAESNGVPLQLFTPVRITSLLEYEAIFGKGPNTPVTIEIDDLTNTNPVVRNITTGIGTMPGFKLYYNLQMYFINGGGPCYIMPVGFYSATIAMNPIIQGLNEIEKIDETTLLLFPDALDLTDAEVKAIYDAGLAQCEKLKDRFVIMDVRQATGNPATDAGTFRSGGVGSDNLKYGGAYYPDLSTILNYSINENLAHITSQKVNGTTVANSGIVIDLLNHMEKTLLLINEGKANARLAITTFSTGGVAGYNNAIQTETGLAVTKLANVVTFIASFSSATTEVVDADTNASGPFDTANNTYVGAANQANAIALLNAYDSLIADFIIAKTAVYDAMKAVGTFVLGSLAYLRDENPTLYNSILASLNTNFVELNPSGSMAGIYARVDRERGVWKAPANVGVRGVVGPSVLITNSEQDGLNIDATSGKSINALRAFTGKGTLVWGGRTLAGNDNEWRYINVRRLFIFVEESIAEATEFVVFEPNTANTWQRVRGMIEAFLTSLWRDGALAGATTQEAFFVRVGIGTTMTPQDILEGRMIVEVGLAAVRPAEFIVLKFMHKLQES